MKREKILSFLKQRFKGPVQAFNVPGPDSPYLIYDEDGVQILYEESYDYIEIYGLTDAEFDLLIQESEGFFWEYN